MTRKIFAHDVVLVYRPLSTQAGYGPALGTSQFKAEWYATEHQLRRELGALGVEAAILEVDVPEHGMIRDCLLVVGRQIRLALLQLAPREIRGNPCWCATAPEPAASEREVELHDARCEAATNAWIRAGHAGVTF